MWWHALQDAPPPEIRVALQLRPDDSSAGLQPLVAPHLSCPADATVGHLQQASLPHARSCLWQPACNASSVFPGRFFQVVILTPLNYMQMLSQLHAGGGDGSLAEGATPPQQYVIQAGSPLGDPQRFSAQHGGRSLDPSVALHVLSCARLDSRAALLLTFSKG